MAQSHSHKKYAVEVLTSNTKIKLDDASFKKIEKLVEEKLDSCFAYSTTPTSDLAKCKKSLKTIQSSGFDKAQIVVYYKNKRSYLIKPSEKEIITETPKAAPPVQEEEKTPIFIFIR
jgi:uncharacterized Rmd1/YagE family protein